MGPGRRPARRGRASGEPPAGPGPRTGAILALRAWLAERDGDRRAERTSLEELIARKPSGAAAYERLADLAAQDGDVDRLAELRRRKAAAEAAVERYRVLINEADLPPHAAELARAAEACGRWVDARAWWSFAARRDPSVAAEAAAALTRLAAADPPPAPDGRSLAELLGLSGPREVEQADVAAGLITTPRFTDEAERAGSPSPSTTGPATCTSSPRP